MRRNGRDPDPRRASPQDHRPCPWTLHDRLGSGYGHVREVARGRGLQGQRGEQNEVLRAL